MSRKQVVNERPLSDPLLPQNCGLGSAKFCTGRWPATGLVFPSDQGSQYTATRLNDIHDYYAVNQRISRLDNCYELSMPNHIEDALKPDYLTV